MVWSLFRISITKSYMSKKNFWARWKGIERNNEIKSVDMWKIWQFLLLGLGLLRSGYGRFSSRNKTHTRRVENWIVFASSRKYSQRNAWKRSKSFFSLLFSSLWWSRQSRSHSLTSSYRWCACVFVPVSEPCRVMDPLKIDSGRWKRRGRTTNNGSIKTTFVTFWNVFRSFISSHHLFSSTLNSVFQASNAIVFFRA